MNQWIERLRSTDDSKLMLIPRLVAGLPLLVIGAGHLFDPQPFMAILEAARIPMPGLNAVFAPLAELLASGLLTSGLFARVGGLVGLTTMLAALYSHFVIDPASLPDNVMLPPIVLPVVVFAGALYVAWRGAGRFSLDHRSEGAAL